MLYKKLTLVSLYLVIFSFILPQWSTAQEVYDLQFANVVVDCDAETLCFDIEIKANAPGTEFFFGDTNIRFSFTNNLDNPVIVQELDVSGNVPGPGPSGFSFYSPHNLSGSLDTVVSYNVEFFTGDGILIGATDYVSIGRVCLDILDFNGSAELTFHTQAIFPATFVGTVNADGSLGGPAAGGTFTNYTQDLTTSCTCAALDLGINFDGFPGQTSWDIMDATGAVVASGGGYGMLPGNSNTTENTCLPDGCYTLNFYDSLNNGMCPFQSTATSAGTFITPGTVITPGSVVATLGTVVVPSLCGNYSLTDANGNVIANGGGRFGASETNSFCIVGGVPQLVVNHDEMYARQIVEADLSELTLAPNPVQNQLNISYKVSTNSEIQLSILDITGKIIHQYILEAEDFSNIQLDVSELNAGFYVVQLRSKNALISNKFVKQ